MPKYLKFLLLCVIWSTTWAILKIGLDQTPPMVGLALRFSCAAIILLSAVFWTGRRIATDRLSLRLYALIGLINMALSYFCTYWGTQFIPSGLSSILWATLPLFVGLFAWWMLKDDRRGWISVVSIGIALIGVGLILSDQQLIFDRKLLWGSLVVLFGVGVTAYPTVVLKQAQDSYDPLVLTAMSMLIGGTVHLIGATVAGEWSQMVWDSRNIGAVLYLGIFGSALAFLVYYSLLRQINVVKLSFVTFMTPVFATIIGWLWLKETVTLREIVGMVLIFTGLFLYDWKKYIGFFYQVSEPIK